MTTSFRLAYGPNARSDRGCAWPRPQCERAADVSDDDRSMTLLMKPSENLATTILSMPLSDELPTPMVRMKMTTTMMPQLAARLTVQLMSPATRFR